MKKETPDHKFRAEIYTDKISVKNVLCEVYLPQKRTGKIEIKLLPSEKQSGKLEDLFEFSLKGKMKGFSGKAETIIRGEKIFTLRGSRKHWGPSIIERVKICEPVDLKIISLFHEPEKEHKNDKIIFWITPSIFLRPLESIEDSYTGSIKTKIIKKISVTLENNIKIFFRQNYNYYTNPEGEKVTYTELVAETGSRKKIKENQIGKEIIECLDDFLILVSFAERHRSVCIGWDFYNAEGRTRFYRRNIAIPKPTKDFDDYDALIPRGAFDDFISKSYKTFIKLESRDLVRQSMQYVVSSSNTTIESSFKTLFSALETLLLFFRMSKDFETILSPEEWKVFEIDLKKWIKTHELFSKKASKEKRRLIYEKIVELNRISFSNVFNRLCESYKIDLTDLWPMTDNANGLSLITIRNRLVHGDYFNPIQLNSLFVAREHLMWTVERVLLSILDWPIAKSHVNEDFLSKVFVFTRNWENDRKILSS